MMQSSPADNLHSHLSERQISKLIWQPWFAWKPVKLSSGSIAWLETVYRRKNTIEISRYPDYSPGDFTTSVSISDYKYITKIDYLVEAIKGNQSCYDKAQTIFRENKEGTFEISNGDS